MILKKLGANLEDKEYTRDEFLTILSKVNHHALSIFGTLVYSTVTFPLFTRFFMVASLPLSNLYFAPI